LFSLLIAGVVGIFVSNPQISFPGFTQFKTNLGYLFPLLFVTVACGAISGFHSLVSAGTTSKQLNVETDARPVGYGSMLVEAVLAVIALITAITIIQGDYSMLIKAEGGGPIGIFSSGLGQFMATLGIPVKAGTTFAALAISAFALTTMDTATRLGRFTFQEFFEDNSKFAFFGKNRYFGTLITVLLAALLAFSGTGTALWPMFGSANQLLASLVLLAVTVWLACIKKKNTFVKIPMIFMAFVTLAALINIIYKNWMAKNVPLLIVGILLFVVAVILFAQAVQRLKNLKNTECENTKFDKGGNINA
jgi:carbon starvation protein